MRDRLILLLEKADLAIASCAGVVAPGALEPLVEAVRAVRTRLAYPDDVLVVALAGGTGSGKSSLFNVLVGEEVVDVGGVRPTTSHPSAAVPEGLGGALDGYLDAIGVEERHPYDGSSLCLVDLPDTDSVAAEHRHRVDAILPLVDVVVWVTDPEKYRDARLHEGYLRPLAAYAAQFVVVLNQIDRVSQDEAVALIDDLAEALAADGLGALPVLAVAAAPVAGPPIGIDALEIALASKSGARDALYDKLLVDIAMTARSLEDRTGHTTSFDERAEASVAETTALIVAGDLAGATRAMTGFLDSIAVETGGETAVKVERLSADAPQHIQRIAAETEVMRRGGLLRMMSRQHVRDPAHVHRLVAETIIRPVRAVLAKRAVALATIADLALDVESLRNTPRR